MSDVVIDASADVVGARQIRPAWRQPLALTGAAIAIAWLVIAVFAPLIAPYDPLAQTFPSFQGPSEQHPFGTDELGRDVLSRVIFGSRISIPLALLLVALAATIGSTLGALAGYFRGFTDGIVMRTADLVFAFPAIILAMVVTAVLGRGLRNAVLAIVIVAWPAYSRVVRGLVLSIGDSEYVQSSRLLGVSARRALFREVLPNIAGGVLVLATLDLGTAILLLAGLSFLGLGDSLRTRSGARWSRPAHSHCQDWLAAWALPRPRISPPSSPSTSSATACATCLTHVPPVRGGKIVAPLLEVEGLRIHLPTREGSVTVVDGVDYAIKPAEVFGVAGESGSGKTMSVLALLGLLPPGEHRGGTRAVRWT